MTDIAFMSWSQNGKPYRGLEIHDNDNQKSTICVFIILAKNVLKFSLKDKKHNG